MPHVVRILIYSAIHNDEWNPKSAVKSYLKEIGEPNLVKTSEFFEVMIIRSELMRISAKDLMNLAEEKMLTNEIGRIIVEFKGGAVSLAHV